MKARRGDIERAALKMGDTRLFLLHGADASGSNALAAALLRGLGPAAERVALAPVALKSDPALLADEAASISLFGERRLIQVDGGGDELLDSVVNLLTAPAAGNPVVIVAGALKKTSKLLTLAEGSPHALACASYVPEGRDAERMVVEIGHAAGLDIASDLARRIADASGGDRALATFEIDKYALYLDAASDRRARLDADVVDMLSADNNEADLSRIADAALDGDARMLRAELAQLAGDGSDAIPTLRALARRLLVLARHRRDVEDGRTVDAVMASAGNSLFYKDRGAVGRQLGRWNAERLATALGRVLDAERGVKSPGSLGAEAVGEMLFSVAQAAARGR